MMHLPLQEEWSPELLSELQRAVPLLESSALEELLEGQDAQQRQSDPWLHSENGPGWPRNARDDSGLRWGGWAFDGGQGFFTGHRSSASGTGPADAGELATELLSDKAMALPMSTLTSGKRKTYPNKSIFQAHVCCIMDPLQVPKVLESLQTSSYFKSVRSWPYAYRIISPFDGQVHEYSEDDNDPGAGEKMLALLKRMGLENLLLIMAHWDFGNSNRLGLELYKCINEQCKELLKELQQAVVTSFPPEELMIERLTPSSINSYPALEEWPAKHRGDLSSEMSCESDQSACSRLPATKRNIDLRAIGPTPPPETIWANRAVVTQPSRRQQLPLMSNSTEQKSPQSRKQASVIKSEDNQDFGPLSGQQCQITTRVVDKPQKLCSRKAIVSSPSDIIDSLRDKRASANPKLVQGHRGFFITEQPDSSPTDRDGKIPDTEQLLAMSTQDLLKMADNLRSERSQLEKVLIKMANADEVINKLKLPIFFGHDESRRQSRDGRGPNLKYWFHSQVCIPQDEQQGRG